MNSDKIAIEEVKIISDWTKELFQEHPELFLAALEERIPEASSEIDTLLRRLREQGFKTRIILDLNCGIGRHSVELGKRGINVLGTDLSSRYIEIAKERAKKEGVEKNMRFRVADMRRIGSELSDEKPFDGVINLYTSFGFYDDETNENVLRQCCKLVRPEGFFALEIINRDWIVRNFQERDFSRYKDMMVLEERRLDFKTSRAYTTWTYLLQQDDNHFILKKQITMDHRIWSLHELAKMFERTGWEFKVAYPGLDQQTSDVPLIEVKNLLFIAKRQKR